MAERIVIDAGDLWRPSGVVAQELRQERRSQLDARRLAALIIDGLVLAPVTVTCALMFGVRAGGIVSAAVALSYAFLAEALTGQTLGKAAMGLRVVRLDGQTLGAASCAARNVLLLVDTMLLCAIGVASMLLTGRYRRQRVGDLVAGTVVTWSNDHSHRPLRDTLRPFVLVGYPLCWVAAACALALAMTGAEAEATYRAELASLCQRAETTSAGHTGADLLDQLAVASFDFEHGLAATKPPKALKGAHKRLLAYRHAQGSAFKRSARELRRSSDPRVTAQTFALAIERASRGEKAALRRAGVGLCL